MSELADYARLSTIIGCPSYAIQLIFKMQSIVDVARAYAYSIPTAHHRLDAMRSSIGYS